MAKQSQLSIVILEGVERPKNLSDEGEPPRFFASLRMTGEIASPSSGRTHKDGGNFFSTLHYLPSFIKLTLDIIV